MKLLDKAIEASAPIRLLVSSVTELAAGVTTCAAQLKALATSIAFLAQNQLTHQQLIQQMWVVQQALLKRHQESGIDMRMPDIDKAPSAPEKTEDDKPSPKIKLN